MDSGVVGICANGKKCYKTKIDAEFALYQCDRSNRLFDNHNRQEKRVYFCPTCKHFHLTSQDKKQVLTWKNLNNARK